MKPTDDKLDILQNLEFSVIEVWRRHPEMSDYAALSGYQAAYRIFRAEARGQAPKPHELSGLDAEVFDAVKAMCDFRLGRTRPSMDAPEGIPPVPLETIVACLQELSKSVERHTKLSGRQGYLTFVERFLP